MKYHIGQSFTGGYPADLHDWCRENNAILTMKPNTGQYIIRESRNTAAPAMLTAAPVLTAGLPAPEPHAELAAELADGNTEIRRLERVPDIPDTPAPFALVQCVFGADDEQLGAIRQAIGYIGHDSPRPAEWVIVEAQTAETGPQLTDLAEFYGFTHITRVIDSGSDNIFMKEALWNIGAHAAQSDRLVFLDADCIFINPNWAYHVNRALDGCDFGSPHGFAYYAEIPENETNPDYCRLLPSTGYCKANHTGKNGHPGFGIMMKRRVFDTLGGLPCCSSAGADTWTWFRILGHWNYPYTTCRMPYNAPFIYNWGIRPKPVIGSTHEVICHIDHGPKNRRHYQAQALLARWCTSRPYEDITLTADGIPVWADNPGARIHRAARAEFMAERDNFPTSSPAIRAARAIFDRHAETEYGEIDTDHPLIIATALRSGGTYTANHVLALRDLFSEYCLTPHQFWCFSDIDIPGVTCIPLVSTPHQTPLQYVQNEIFRNVYPAGASVLGVDLDVIPVAPFTLHRAPENEFAMAWEQHNWHRSNRCIWNGGTVYFRGDYSCIFTELIGSAIDGLDVPAADFAFISSQEWIAGVLFKHGIRITDILRHIPLEFYNEKSARDNPASALVHFLGNVKPWDLKEKPEWLPQRAFRPD